MQTKHWVSWMYVFKGRKTCCFLNRKCETCKEKTSETDFRRYGVTLRIYSFFVCKHGELRGKNVCFSDTIDFDIFFLIERAKVHG